MPEMSKTELSSPADIAREAQVEHKGPWAGAPKGWQNFRQPTKENFPKLSKRELKELKKDFPEGAWGLAGGIGESQEAFLEMLNSFQSDKPFEITLSTARMKGVETSLAIRLGAFGASRAVEMIDNKDMLFPGFINEIVKMTRLATIHQIATTSPVPVSFKGNLIVTGENGNPTIVRQGYESPPQLVNEFVVNDKDHGDSFPLCPWLPPKLEPLFKFLQEKYHGGVRNYTATEVEASRRQISTYFSMIHLSAGLSGSLSQHDMLALQRTNDRIMSGAHDETPIAKLIAMIPQIHPMLASDKIETLGQVYETHLTETRIFHTMRTAGIAVGMQVKTPSGMLQEVSGTVSMGDFMDQLLSSQKQLEVIMQGITDAGPRDAIRGLLKMNSDKQPGSVVEEGKLVWQVFSDRLGLYDEHHNWVSLKDIIFSGQNPVEMNPVELSKQINDSVIRTNMPDIEVMMALTKESLGVYPMDENVVGAIYPLYLMAREFSRGLLLDMMLAPDFQSKAGKQVRKLRRCVYDVWTYWQGKTGLNELQKTFPYKDFVSERLIPAFIDKINIEEPQNWKQSLRTEITYLGGIWLEGFDNYYSYNALARDVIANLLTKPTLLPSRNPEIEGYITALALNTSTTTRAQKIEVYRKYLHDSFVEKKRMGKEEFIRRMSEFERFLNYWVDGGPLKSQYQSDINSGKFPQNFTLEQWLKHRIKNELYASKSQRQGTLRTKEEMLAAFETLTEAEKAVLNLAISQPNGQQNHLINIKSLVSEMGIKFDHDSGLLGLGELVKKFSWRNFPINAIPPRLVDGTSVGGYIVDHVNLTNDTAEFSKNIGTPQQQESVGQMPFTGENIDASQEFGLVKFAGEYLQKTFHFVPYPNQRERALEFWKILLWSTTPLKSNELITATWQAIPKGADKPTHQEMFVPVNLFHPSEQKWLKGIGMRGSSDAGREGMIFLGDYPVRFRLRFGDIKNIFGDMKKAADRCSQPLTIIGMERPDYNTIPWKETIESVIRSSAGNELLHADDAAELYRFAESKLDPKHKIISETSAQKSRRRQMDIGEIAKTLGQLAKNLPKF